MDHRPILPFDKRKRRVRAWSSAQRFMRDQLLYVRPQVAGPEISETLEERLGKLEASFLLDDLHASGVTSLRDLTYWACLVTQPDYLLITHEAIGIETVVDDKTNIVAWAELLYVLRVEESRRLWPGEQSFAKLTRLREQYKPIAKELYLRCIDRYDVWEGQAFNSSLSAFMPPNRGSVRLQAPALDENKPQKALKAKKKRVPKPKFAAVTVDRVIALEFTKNQKKWLLDHNEEHFRPPVDATPLEKREFFLQVWNKFSIAFPDNTFETSRSCSESDLFRHSVWGRQIVIASRHERWFARKEA